MNPALGKLLLAVSALTLVAAATASRCGGALDEAPAWSAQLHLHGPFSEGAGSIDSHSYQATDVGVDLLWWSDHDFRTDSFRAPAHFGFEGRSDPI